MLGSATPPLVCRPLAIPRPWGGERAGAFADLPPRPGERIGEWWLLSTRADHPTLVANAPFAERPLAQVLESAGERILGAHYATQRRFPLLLKLLDTEAPLSVQVHPTEAALPGEGKTESWYLLDARPGADFWIGLADGVALAPFFARVRAGDDPVPLLRRHAARPGLVAHLHAGLIHALGGGIVALEIQTSADTTYRIFDWHRRPARALHLDRAQQVADPDQRAALPEPRPLPPAAPPRELLVDCPDYRVERLRMTAPTRLSTHDDRFEVFVPFGSGMRVAAESGTVDVPRGHAVVVPARSGAVVLTPTAPLELLRVLPNFEGTP